jgi:hypothetical protein
VHWFASPGQWGYHSVNAWEVLASSPDGKSAHASNVLELLTCSSRSFAFGRSNADSLYLHRWQVQCCILDLHTRPAYSHLHTHTASFHLHTHTTSVRPAYPHHSAG